MRRREDCHHVPDRATLRRMAAYVLPGRIYFLENDPDDDTERRAVLMRKLNGDWWVEDSQEGEDFEPATVEGALALVARILKLP